MKTITKLFLAGTALTAGGVASAQINVPPTNPAGSDIVLFVTDTTTHAYFVQDLGVQLDSLGVTTASVAADVAAGNLYSVFGSPTNPGPLGSGSSITVGAGLISDGIDSALATFESLHTGDTFYYGIMAGAQGDGSFNPGQARLLANYTAANGATQFTDEPSSNGIGQAASSLNQFFAGVNAGTTGYSAPSGIGAQAVSSFSQTSGANGAAIGTTTFLYELASTGAGNDANIYASTVGITVGLGGAISGLVSGSNTPVPLPAAIWLLGSGVVGLFGIGRRRAASAA